ncbi:MAG TPA: hypothetical protein VF278_24215 [Pirellulales bacterium]
MSDKPTPIPLHELAPFEEDIPGFIEHLWPDFKLEPYQAEILNSVRANKHTFVYSGHKMGKSLVAALATLWFFVTRSPATVLLISAKEQQLEQVIWAEILTLLQKANRRLPIAVNRLRLRVLDEEEEFVPRHEVLGCAASEPESLQGHNLPTSEDGRPRVLVVCEEASAVPDRFIEALLPQSHRLLAIGNPLRVEGWFYEGCKKGTEAYPWRPLPLPEGEGTDASRPHPNPLPEGEGTNAVLRWVRHVDPEESPNLIESRRMDREGITGEYPLVTPGLLSRQEFDEWEATWDEPRKRVRLYGKLPSEDEMKLFPPTWLELAKQLGEKLRRQIARCDEWRDDGPYALGVDAAFGGGDLTAWVVLGRYGVRHVHAISTPNTATISGYTIELMRQYRINAWAVAFDSGGGGKQIADMLRDQNEMKFGAIVDVSFGAKALEPKKYHNRRTELYGELRMALEPTDARRELLTKQVSRWPESVTCLALPPDESKLMEDLAVLPYEWDGEGKQRLPPKDHARRDISSHSERSVRERLGGRSPDRGDALVLAWFAWTRAREYRRLERVKRPVVYT